MKLSELTRRRFDHVLRSIWATNESNLLLEIEYINFNIIHGDIVRYSLNSLISLYF